MQQNTYELARLLRTIQRRVYGQKTEVPHLMRISLIIVRLMT